jgi:glycosyltransferase involved in cell wall biosynthesis
MYNLTIVTINYNNLEGLQRTLDSIVNQTWREFEYIVIDGGSSDGSAAYIASQSEHIDYWVSETDNGIYNAMNKGINMATGDYILFINSGDELYSNSILEEVITELYSDDVVYFDLLLLDKKESQKWILPEKLNYKVFIESTIGHPASFIKRELFLKYGNYDESLRISSDWKFFFWVIIVNKATTRKVNKVLSKFYLDGISSADVLGVKNEREKVLIENFQDYKHLYELETKFEIIKKSRLIKYLKFLGFFKYI